MVQSYASVAGSKFLMLPYLIESGLGNADTFSLPFSFNVAYQRGGARVGGEYVVHVRC